MRKTGIILLVLGILISCSKKENQLNDTPLGESEATIRSYPYADSISTPMGTFYKFIFTDSVHFSIQWGNQDESYSSEKLFEFNSTMFNLESSSKDAILLTRSCGTSCKEGIVLLLTNENNLKEYLFLMANDLKKNLVAYIPAQSQDTLITIENFKTGKTQVLADVSLCPAAFQGECIDSLAFFNDKFYIQWQGSKWTRHEKDTQERTINISNLITQ